MKTKYSSLVKKFQLRPICNDSQLEKAKVVMNSLLGIERTIGEDNYLDALGNLIRTYETSTMPLPNATQGDVLRSLLEEKGINQVELSKGTGIDAANISRMLSNKKGIGRKSMLKFGQFFQVPPARFLV